MGEQFPKINPSVDAQLEAMRKPAMLGNAERLKEKREAEMNELADRKEKILAKLPKKDREEFEEIQDRIYRLREDLARGADTLRRMK